jgi:uncharacterized protein YajQ (UPF0234 family)
VAKKEIQNRYDFSGSNSIDRFNKKELTMHIVTETEMRMDTVLDIIVSRGAKQDSDRAAMIRAKSTMLKARMTSKTLKMKNGLDKEVMKKIVKAIKDSGLKVQASQMDQDRSGSPAKK